MPCGCNSICDNDCAVNQLCTGHESACSNEFTFSTITKGAIIRASEIQELQTAINMERADTGRRYNASEPAYCNTHTPGDLACTNNEFSAYSYTSGLVKDSKILAAHFDDAKNSNNEVTNNSGYGATISTSFLQGGIILASDIVDMQNKINQTRNVCICDSHCNCDPADCGCDAECPSDDAGYI
jgi:hypothetical protein